MRVGRGRGDDAGNFQFYGIIPIVECDELPNGISVTEQATATFGCDDHRAGPGECGRCVAAQQGEAGRQEEAVSLILRQLGKRFGELPDDIRASISELPLTQTEELGEALLDFSALSDVQSWLANHAS